MRLVNDGVTDNSEALRAAGINPEALVAALVPPACTCGYEPTPTQHRFFCPWREWWLSKKATDLMFSQGGVS